MFKRVLRLEITFSRNKPVKGSSYIPLPKGLKSRSFISVQNKNDHHREKDPQRISDLEKYVDELNWDGIEFPIPCARGCIGSSKRLTTCLCWFSVT